MGLGLDIPPLNCTPVRSATFVQLKKRSSSDVGFTQIVLARELVILY
ncbi:hypothetical protein ACLBR5_19725 [Escherichia coli]